MKVLNKPLRKSFATAGFCELCNFYCVKRAGHHLWTRTPEITIRINLIALGSEIKLPDGRTRFTCPCHRKIHDGAVSRERVLEVVALREKCLPEEITEIMQWMRRLVKPTESQIINGLEELSAPAKLIAMRELSEAGVLVEVGR